jgi:hypothetical protein
MFGFWNKLSKLDYINFEKQKEYLTFPPIKNVISIFLLL